MNTLPNRDEVLRLLWNNPVEIGHWLGFRDLTELHNKWLKAFLYGEGDMTLQAHRGSYKTTVLTLFFALHIILFPNETLLFFRKSGTAEIMRQVIKILESGCVQTICETLYGKPLVLVRASAAEIQTNLPTTNRGASQLLGLGIRTSITGMHADIIVTDDIVNIFDRISEAEREGTKRAYMEMQNIKNRGGRIINTGTPWHKDDCFTLMPNPARVDCYQSGLMTEEQIQHIKDVMSPSLFAANYELRHIASEELIFPEPEIGGDIAFIYNGECHVDSAFYGGDYTAFTIMTQHEGKYYVFGKMWRKHVEDCYADIMNYYNEYRCGSLHNELNADKGMVAKELRGLGIRVKTYTENMNKYVKIVTYLKAIWKDVVFVEGTDPEYIAQICDYNEHAAHDDAPDSAASLARIMQTGGVKLKTFAGGIY